MITLVGVGHVFDIGARVRDVVLARRPKVVALELDPLRYSALLSRRREARGVSLLHLLASLESKIGREYGVQVGDEMLAAAQAAREAGSELALIDRDSRDVLVRTWRAMSFGGRGRVLVGGVRGGFVGGGRGGGGGGGADRGVGGGAADREAHPHRRAGRAQGRADPGDPRREGGRPRDRGGRPCVGAE